MKSNLDKLFKSNDKMEEDGIWFEVADGVKFKVRRFGGENSPSVKAAFAKHYKPFAALIQNGSMPHKKERKIMAKIFVESCLLDWDGVEIDGKATPFSKEVAEEFMLSLPDLMETLIQHANDSQNYRETLGNS